MTIKKVVILIKQTVNSIIKDLDKSERNINNISKDIILSDSDKITFIDINKELAKSYNITYYSDDMILFECDKHIFKCLYLEVVNSNTNQLHKWISITIRD